MDKWMQQHNLHTLELKAVKEFEARKLGDKRFRTLKTNKLSKKKTNNSYEMKWFARSAGGQRIDY